MEIRVTRDTMSDIYFDALRIRNQVFVKEQGVPYELEVGNALEEASSVHFVLYDDGLAKGTVRLLADWDEKSANSTNGNFKRSKRSWLCNSSNQSSD